MNFEYARSPVMMLPEETVVVVVDVQEKLYPSISQSENVLRNICRLMDAAEILEIPTLLTEQYPQGLGPTIHEVRGKVNQTIEKITFSCMGCPEFVTQLVRLQRRKILVTGIEAHICVAQTVLDLVAEGYDVHVPVDAIGSRNELDYGIALRRLEAQGVDLTTAEAIIFEWCERAGTEKFKRLRELI